MGTSKRLGADAARRLRHRGGWRVNFASHPTDAEPLPGADFLRLALGRDRLRRQSICQRVE